MPSPRRVGVKGAEAASLAIIALQGPGVELEATRAMGAWGLYEVRLTQAPAQPIDLASAVLDDRLLAIDDGDVVGALRIVFLPEHVKIGRVAVAQYARGRGTYTSSRCGAIAGSPSSVLALLPMPRTNSSVLSS